METEIEYSFSSPVSIAKDELLEGGHIVPMKEMEGDLFVVRIAKNLEEKSKIEPLQKSSSSSSTPQTSPDKPTDVNSVQ